MTHCFYQIASEFEHISAQFLWATLHVIRKNAAVSILVSVKDIPAKLGQTT
jgi:hypothetical protein